MPGRLSFSLLDHSKEVKNTSLLTGNVTAVSLPGLLTQIGTLRAAIDAITLGTVAGEMLVAFDTNLSNAIPASELAQVETVWIVQYEDALPFFDDPVNAIPNEGFGKKFSLSIGTADLVGRLLPNSDEADLADAGIAAFVTAFEAIARSPYGGTVNVLKITSGGRNL